MIGRGFEGEGQGGSSAAGGANRRAEENAKRGLKKLDVRDRGTTGTHCWRSRRRPCTCRRPRAAMGRGIRGGFVRRDDGEAGRREGGSQPGRPANRRVGSFGCLGRPEPTNSESRKKLKQTREPRAGDARWRRWSRSRPRRRCRSPTLSLFLFSGGSLGAR